MADQDPHSSQPPSPTRPPAFSGPFLFVNKNASNLRTRKREEVFAVRSHAMQIARRTKKQATAASTASGTANQTESASRGSFSGKLPQHSEDADGEIEEHGQTKHSVASPSRLQSPTRKQLVVDAPGLHPSAALRSNTASPSYLGAARPHTKPTASALATSDLRLSSEYVTFLTQYIQNTHPTSPIGHGNSDPFAAAALPISAFFDSLIKLWRLGFMSNFWPAYIYLDPTHQVSQLTDDWLHGAVICNEAMLHGLFAGALSFVTNYSPPSAATPILYAKGVHHHGKCLEATRARLALPDIAEEEALNMMHQSAIYSFHCGDVEASDVHRTASIRIFANLENGLDDVHTLLKLLLILCDILMASNLPRRPSISLKRWAPRSWHEEENLQEMRHIFSFDPSPFMSSDRDVLGVSGALLSPSDRHIALQMLSLMTLHREALYANRLAMDLSGDGAESMRADTIFDWLSLRQYALVGHSVELYMDMLEAESHMQNDLSSQSRLQQVLNSCILLASSYTFQFIMRTSRGNCCLGYIPIHHLRDRLTLLMALMSDARRKGLGPGSSSLVRPDTLLFLLFPGAVMEESGSVTRNWNVAAAAARMQYGGTPLGTVPTPSDTDQGLLHTKWFSVHFSMVCQRLEITNWRQVKVILERFIYDDGVLEGLVKRLVSKSGGLLSRLGFGSPYMSDVTTRGESEGTPGHGMLSRSGSFMASELGVAAERGTVSSTAGAGSLSPQQLATLHSPLHAPLHSNGTVGSRMSSINTSHYLGQANAQDLTMPREQDSYFTLGSGWEDADLDLPGALD